MPTDGGGGQLSMSEAPYAALSGDDSRDDHDDTARADGNDASEVRVAERPRLWFGYDAAVWAILLLEMIAEASRGFVLPSMAGYLGTLHQPPSSLPTAVALFSAGRFVASLSLGYLSTMVPYRNVMAGALVVGCCGSLLYASATEGSIWLLFAGRALSGFSSGTLSVSRAALAAVSRPDDRLKVMSHLGAARFVGYALTPGASWAFQPAGSDPNNMANQFRLPGWLLVALDLTVVLVVLRHVPADHGSPRGVGAAVARREAGERAHARNESSTTGNDERSVAMVAPSHDSIRVADAASTGTKATSPTRSSVRDDAIGVCGIPRRTLVIALFFAINLLSRGILSLFEAVAAPWYLVAIGDSDNDSATDIGQYLLVLGLVGFAVFLALPRVRKTGKVSDEGLLAVGLGITIVGSLCFIRVGGAPLSEAQFVIGSVLLWSFGSSITSAVCSAVFSVFLGSKPQGAMMGLFGAFGSVGRIAFPVAGEFAVQYTLLLSAVLELLCVAAVVAFAWGARRGHVPAMRASQ